MEVGAKEITFIERSGLIFGFIFGCFQTCLWYFYQASWVLPVGGFAVSNFFFLTRTMTPRGCRFISVYVAVVVD